MSRQRDTGKARRREPRSPPPAPRLNATRLLTRNELSSLLGTHPATIQAWIGEGLPVEVVGGKGRPSKFRMASVWRWGLERERQRAAVASGVAAGAGDGGAVSLALERARLARAQTRRQEFAMRKLEGELLDAGEVGRAWSVIILAIRAKLLGLPRGMAGRLADAIVSAYLGAAGGPSLQPATVVGETLLGEAMRDALRELQGWEPPVAQNGNGVVVPAAVTAAG